MSAIPAARAELVDEIAHLVSERRNPATMGIDLMPTVEILKTINAEDATVPGAVAKTLPDVARAVDAIVDSFGRGGRLVYVGAGTSGRLGVLDASECPPTFSVPPGMVIGLIAGGPDALTNAVEGMEDRPEAGVEALQNISLTARDVVVGIAVSGRTPFVIGALEFANHAGATTVALSCNPHSVIAGMADIAISPVVGPEVITGSTRLKSGTAQKLVLNMLTTASMIRIGKTYENLMVDLNASNEKLVARSLHIVMQATECSASDAQDALNNANNDVKLAILTLLTGQGVDEARDQLNAAGGFLRRALSKTEAQ